MSEPPASPRLIFILGPSAVGKMTVAQELQRLTGYRLLVNHMVVDLATEFFEFGTPGFDSLARPFTRLIFETCAEQRVDLITTHALLFSGPRGLQIVHEWPAPFRAVGGSVAFVELTAPLEVRLARNLTENRRRHKKVGWSTEERLREMEGWGRWTSLPGELPPGDAHLVIDTTELSAGATARVIGQRLALGGQPA
jgi:cytidylate kinase